MPKPIRIQSGQELQKLPGSEALKPAQDQVAQSDKSLFNKSKRPFDHLKRFIVHRELNISHLVFLQKGVEAKGSQGQRSRGLAVRLCKQEEEMRLLF